MNSMYPGHHPSSDMLRSYCAGDLDDIIGMMVAAHINFCPECQRQAKRIDEELAAKSLQYAPFAKPANLDLSAMLDRVTATPPAVTGNARVLQDEPADSINVRIRGRQIEVPAVLSGIVQRSGAWNHVVNELWQSPVQGHGHGYQVDFIYMYPGGTVPSHTHKGREVTLVLDGSFSDSDGEYAAGDFLIKTSSDEHNPVSEKGCLCLAAIDAPLHFTSGMSRLINPFSQLFFRSEA